jgi:uncharacterized protein
MDERTTSLAAEAEALKRAYAALNRNDIPAFAEVLDPQIERIEPTGFPQSGTYRGIDAVTAHVTRARDTWADGSCEPQQFIAAGDKVVVVAHVHVRLKTETDFRDGQIGDVFTFRDGKAIQWRTFADKQQALDWAGIAAPNDGGTPPPAHDRRPHRSA